MEFKNTIGPHVMMVVVTLKRQVWDGLFMKHIKPIQKIQLMKIEKIFEKKHERQLFNINTFTYERAKLTQKYYKY
jgi:hypothetical protein